MPKGVPRLGASVGNTPAKTDSVVENLSHAPRPEVLGELKFKSPGMTAWQDPDFQAIIEMEQGPPPWETSVQDSSNARNFLKCPDDWELRWVNPRLLDQDGWRGWTPVRAKDPRIIIHVPSMISPEMQIRRGGYGGDILAYMPKHWFKIRREQYERRVAAHTQSSVDRLETLKDEFKRGKFGPHQTLESAQHPTHTMADGRTMVDP